MGPRALPARRRLTGGAAIRIRRVEGGQPTERTLTGPAVLWRAALPGTWLVSASVRDVDARGVPTSTWVDVGTVTTGEPEKVLVVPP